MTGKPIFMNTDMVRALLEGRKMVTRRLVRWRDSSGKRVPLPADAVYTGKSPMFYTWVGREPYHIEPPYQIGDVLYVRETWARNPLGDGYIYPTEAGGAGQRWRPSIHMPRDAARIFLRVTDVRVERLQDCGNMQAKDEGCTCSSQFARLWDSTIKPADRAACCWEASPWVWVISFERISKEDTYGT